MSGIEKSSGRLERYDAFLCFFYKSKREKKLMSRSMESVAKSTQNLQARKQEFLTNF